MSARVNYVNGQWDGIGTIDPLREALPITTDWKARQLKLQREAYDYERSVARAKQDRELLPSRQPSRQLSQQELRQDHSWLFNGLEAPHEGSSWLPAGHTDGGSQKRFRKSRRHNKRRRTKKSRKTKRIR